MAQWLTNPTRKHEVVGSTPGVTQWDKDPLSCGIGRRRNSELSLLWLWRRPAAIAPIRPLAWELPRAVGAAIEKAKNNNNNKNPMAKEKVS